MTVCQVSIHVWGDSFNPTKPGWLLTASCLLSLGHCWMSSLSAFSKSHSQQAFHACSLTTCKGSHSLPLGACTGGQLCWGVVFVRYIDHWGIHIEVGGINRKGIQNIRGWLTDRIHQAAGRIWVLSMPSGSHSCYPPSCSPASVKTSGLSVLHGIKRNWAYLAAFSIHIWGNPGLNHRLSLCTMGEIISWECLSWHWVVVPWGRGDTSKVKPLLVHFGFFFAPRLCCNFSTGLLGFHKGILIHGWLSKSVCWGKDGGKLLFCHFDNITSCLYFKSWFINYYVYVFSFSLIILIFKDILVVLYFFHL